MAKHYLGNPDLAANKIESVDGASHIQLSAGTNKLVKTTVLRQDNTANTYQVGNSVTLTGWGVFATGAAANKSETVTFGVTFAQAPIVICTYGGDDTGGATTYGAGGNEDKGPVCMKAHSVTTTTFVAQAHTADATNWDANATVFYQWVAIGEIA